MMISMMFRYVTMLLLAGFGVGPSPTAAPSLASAPAVACVSSVNVTASASGGVITVSANGTACSNNVCSISPVGANARVSVNYDTNSGQFAYYDASNSVLTSAPSSILVGLVGTTVDFGVVGASGSEVLALPDPTITVTTGSCGDGGRRR